MYYEEHGDGDPLILIAGLASDSQSWFPVLEQLARHSRVIIFDNRGVGRTTPQEAKNSISLMTDDMVDLMKKLNISSATCLGHSMGGFIAQDLAVRYPEFVNRLILAGTSSFMNARNQSLLFDWVENQESGMPQKRWFRNFFYWIFTPPFFESSEAVDYALKMALEYPYPQSQAGFRKQAEALASFDARKILYQINAPTLVLCGEKDLLFPPEDSIEIFDSLPDKIIRVVLNSAHAIHMENPLGFIQFVNDFMLSDEV